MLFDYPALQSWEDPHAAEIVARQTMADVLQALNVIVLGQPCDDFAIMQRDLEVDEALTAALAKFA